VGFHSRFRGNPNLNLTMKGKKGGGQNLWKRAVSGESAGFKKGSLSLEAIAAGLEGFQNSGGGG